MPGRSRNDFTESDDDHLIEYIATHNPDPSGRQGNKLYIKLTENAGEEWPWSENHTWQSWRERYKKNQDYFDYQIRKFKRKAKQALEAAKDEKQSGKKKDSSIVKSSNVAGTSKAASTVKSAKGAGEKNVIREHRKGGRKTAEQVAQRRNTIAPPKEKKEAPAPEQGLIPAQIGTTQNQKQDPGELPDIDHGALSQDTMAELFGSYEESDTNRDPVEAHGLSDITRDRSTVKAVPQSATVDIDSPRLAQVVLTEKFSEKDPPPAPEQSMPPVILVPSSDSPEPHPTPAKQPKKRLLLRKRADDDNFFASPSRSPAPPTLQDPVPTKKQPLVRIEGPFHSSLKRPRTVEEKDDTNRSPEWPPNRKRRKEGHIHIMQDVQPMLGQKVDDVSMKTSTVAPRPQAVHVNAVASSSKVKLPSAVQPTPVHSDTKHDGFDVSSPRRQSKEKIATTVPRESEGGQHSMAMKKPNAVPPVHSVVDVNHPRIVIEGVPQHGSNLNLPESRTEIRQEFLANNTPPAVSPPPPRAIFNHILPIQHPPDAADPFTQVKPLSAKAAGKARDDAGSFKNENKLPRRIDLHRESLAGKLRRQSGNPNASFASSRPGSALSSYTSTTASSSKKKRKDGARLNHRRTSESLRKSISALDLPPEKKDFAVAATAELEKQIEALAKQYGVSNEIAMKTYLNTRSIEKTKFVLAELFRGLCSLEEELYSRLPKLRHTSNDDEDADSDADLLDGLIPRPSPRPAPRVSSPNLNANQVSPFSSRRRSKSNSPRKRSRPSLVIKPLPSDKDDPPSDYSPPSKSRAGQFLRLVKAGKLEEAIAREQRRVSGLHVVSTQETHARKPSPSVSPVKTAKGKAVAPLEVDQDVPMDVDEGKVVEVVYDKEQEGYDDDDDDEDMYVHTEDDEQDKRKAEDEEASVVVEDEEEEGQPFSNDELSVDEHAQKEDDLEDDLADDGDGDDENEDDEDENEVEDEDEDADEADVASLVAEEEDLKAEVEVEEQIQLDSDKQDGDDSGFASESQMPPPGAQRLPSETLQTFKSEPQSQLQVFSQSQPQSQPEQPTDIRSKEWTSAAEAREYKRLAFDATNDDEENRQAMLKFEERKHPDLLRLASVEWVAEFLQRTKRRVY
ncbi:hypothetical protein D9613_003477 [Agrocybe pediades]|uniref:TERF2-interacting telomeric protein 1 Myb domain-containing protein n=1 Tax=Agrocybe pediades TaxID=84607 RepID=A0A8H4QPN1_9AGAR|nr:hypothetical protein D9613_003477 [Agrocybe pediades]